MLKNRIAALWVQQAGRKKDKLRMNSGMHDEK